MVTWGQNTVHTFGAPTPAPAAGFGSPSASTAPTGGGLFGSLSPAPAPSGGLFGTSTPATTTGGSIFGSPIPAPAGSLFGTPAPSSGGLFGSTSAAPAGSFGGFGAPAPAPTSSLFGSSTTTFGAPSSSLFGITTTQQQQQQQQQQIPAQAALQAHINASARQEADRVRSALESLITAYTGTGANESKFVNIVYNPLSPEQRQMQWVHGMGTGEQIWAPPKPPQVSDAEWNKALVNNPDPHNYVPVALVGAMALQTRVAWQQDRAKELASNAQTLRKSHDTLKERSSRVREDVDQLSRQHSNLRKRLLDVMRRVELARCMNQPLQPDELKAGAHLKSLHQNVTAARSSLFALQEKCRTQPSAALRPPQVLAIPDKGQLLPVLKNHRQAIEKLTLAAKKDMRDVELMQRRVLPKVSSLPHRN